MVLLILRAAGNPAALRGEPTAFVSDDTGLKLCYGKSCCSKQQPPTSGVEVYSP